MSDVSDNSEGEKLESDDKSNRMGPLQDDRMVPEDLTMAVDTELSNEVEATDAMGNLIEQHKEDDYECKEIADDGKEVEDGDAMGNLNESSTRRMIMNAKNLPTMVKKWKMEMPRGI